MLALFRDFGIVPVEAQFPLVKYATGHKLDKRQMFPTEVRDPARQLLGRSPPNWGVTTD
jgi:hypothetical protein